MSLRVLSGIIVPDSSSRKSGSVTIDFHPHTVSGTGTGSEKVSIGPNHPFNSTPAKVVSLRRVKFKDSDRTDLLKPNKSHTEGWNLNDNFDSTGRNSIEVSWGTSNESEVFEISYMFVGDA